jgi:hypothetical protein
MKSLLLLFVAYNLLFASVLIGPLTPPNAPLQHTTAFSDSDFGSPTPTPAPPIRISKPFVAETGQVLSFSFETYGVNNVSEFVINSIDCGSCGMAITALPLPPPGTFITNETILNGPTYNVARSAHYVLIFDTRNQLPCYGFANCVGKLAGMVIATTPIGPSQYASLPVALGVAGLLAIIPPIIWTVRKERQRRTSLGE